MKTSEIINEIRKSQAGILSIVLKDASKYAANAKGEMTWAGTLFTKKYADSQEGDTVIKTGNKETNLSAVERTLTSLIGKGEVQIRLMNGNWITTEIQPEDNNTYDVEFNSETSTMSKGWHATLEECQDYIRTYIRTNESYFEDFKGGYVSIRCNETEEVVHEEEIPQV